MNIDGGGLGIGQYLKQIGDIALVAKVGKVFNGQTARKRPLYRACLGIGDGKVKARRSAGITRILPVHMPFGVYFKVKAEGGRFAWGKGIRRKPAHRYMIAAAAVLTVSPACREAK